MKNVFLLPVLFVGLVLSACSEEGSLNSAPTATSATISTNEDTASIGVTPSVTDADSSDFSFAIVTQGANGNATIVTTNKLVYTPTTPNFYGSDSFNYTATDSGGLSVTGTASVTVTAVDDAPTATNITITDDNGVYVIVGDSLTGDYTYVDVDAENTEGATTLRWLRDGVAISGATALTYTVVAADVPAEITFEVTPRDVPGNAGSVATSSVINTRKPLNDTGITLCGDYAYGASLIHNNDIDCSAQATVPTQTTDGSESINGGDNIPAGQDALYGRDVTDNDINDGHAGFSFIKLDSNGNALDASATSWSCVKDNVTGLIWEVKTPTNIGYTYSWFNSTGVNDGGDAGTADGGDNCLDPARCDTEKYVEDINTANLCGATDWRLPTKHELLSIINYSVFNPSLDVTYFPEVTSEIYWSSSPRAGNNLDVWYVAFGEGGVYYYLKSYSGFNVRLVRGSN